LEAKKDKKAKGNKKSNGGSKDGDPSLPKIKPKRGILFRILGAIFWFCLGSAIFGGTALFVIYLYFAQDLPSVEIMKSYSPKEVTFLYSSDGEVIGEFCSERRFPRRLEDMPKHLINAFLAVEDTDFYRHQGVNIKSVARAAYHNLVSEDIQGASTITQQLTREILLSKERKLSRKIREMILAFRVERALSKDKILELYLNQIYLGSRSYGVEAAAQEYFDKHVEQLSIAESAMLAGITQSPEGKNPLTRPDEAKTRQFHALERMETVGFITKKEADEARAEILNIRGHRVNPYLTVAPFFTEHVRQIIVAKYGEERVLSEGFRVYTTLNTEHQKAADAAAARGLREYDRRRGFKGPIDSFETDYEIEEALKTLEPSYPSDGLVPDKLYKAIVMEVRGDSTLSVQAGPYAGLISKKNLEWILPKGTTLQKRLKRGDMVWVRLSEASETGQFSENKEEALARIGAGEADSLVKDFVLEQKTDIQAALLSMDLTDGGVRAMVGGRDFNENKFNRAFQSKRQPGSSFKPIIFASAMDNGFTPDSIMVDGPTVLDDVGSGQRWKPLNSDQKFLGPMTLYQALASSRNVIAVKLLERIGFEALGKTAFDMGITEPLPHMLSTALGVKEVSLPEMIGAYSSFPNNGARAEPRYITRIEDRHGNVLESFEPVFYQAIPAPTACILTSMLRGAVANGTGSAVKPLNRPVGGKTGTTNEYSDAWFVGFTPEYVTAVWMGADELTSKGVGEVGGKAAAPIFLYHMQKILEKAPVKDFQVPEGAEIKPEGSYGICYKTGTEGTGISETQVGSNQEIDFLRGEMNAEFEEEDMAF
jgi:penicillin-binding protein 1A